MWASVRRYDQNPALAEALAARSEEIKALISEVPGFVSYYLIHDGSDTVSITVAQDQAGVDPRMRSRPIGLANTLPRFPCPRRTSPRARC